MSRPLTPFRHRCHDEEVRRIWVRYCSVSVIQTFFRNPELSGVRGVYEDKVNSENQEVEGNARDAW